MSGRLNLVDRIVFIYNGTIMAHILLSAERLHGWPTWAGIHLLIFGAILAIAASDTRGERTLPHWIHVWYPFVLLIWFYPETGLLRHTIVPRDLDAQLLFWETTFFPQRFYFTLPLSLNVPTLEIFHGIYFSYYIMVWFPAILSFKKDPPSVNEYVFVFMLAMFTHYWFSIVFPASGPVALRQEVMPQGFLFIPIMNFLYNTVDQGGAAFPSTHAAAAVITAVYAGRFFPRLRKLVAVWLFMILVSTVVCSFHYTIDTIAGVVTGSLFLLWGRKLYERITA